MTLPPNKSAPARRGEGRSKAYNPDYLFLLRFLYVSAATVSGLGRKSYYLLRMRRNRKRHNIITGLLGAGALSLLLASVSTAQTPTATPPAAPPVGTQPTPTQTPGGLPPSPTQLPPNSATEQQRPENQTQQAVQPQSGLEQQRRQTAPVVGTPQQVTPQPVSPAVPTGNGTTNTVGKLAPYKSS